MSRLHVTQIQRRIEESVLSLVDIVDIDGKDPTGSTMRSRGLAAFVLMKLGDVPPDVAAAGVTDEYGDNGIDGVLAITDQRRIIVVQSKWAENSNGSAAKSDVLKLREGVDDLVGCNWSKFGQKMKAHRAEIEELLYDTSVRIDIVFAHLGTADISEECRQVMTEYVDDMNNPTEVATFMYVNQGAIHRMLVEESGAPRINLEFDMTDWGMLEGPPPAYYGQLTASQVAKWYSDYGSQLLAKNVRVVIPASEVNDGILNTLKARPDRFWYFNNGITVLCDRLSKAPAGGADRRVGHFSIDGASIVNGAQTVGTLHKHLAGGGDLSAVRVLVRFISLEGAADEFAREVTRATNTQNRIGGREFVSLDALQQRLRDEFAVAGLEYVYRTGEPDPDKAIGCDIIEATVALACSQSPQLATLAKREISRLWEDVTRPPYTSIFNKSTSYLRVWRLVQAIRSVEEMLAVVRRGVDGRDRLILTHGNRALAHILLRQIDTSKIDDPDIDWDVQLGELRARFEKSKDSMIATVNDDYPGYPASLFKNATKVSELVQKVLAAVSPS